MLGLRPSHLRTRLVAGGLIAVSLALTSGCGEDATAGSGEVTAATFCDEFMKNPPAERTAGATRVATEIGVPDPANAQWITLLETRCGAAPDLKLGDFFNHFM